MPVDFRSVDPSLLGFALLGPAFNPAAFAGLLAPGSGFVFAPPGTDFVPSGPRTGLFGAEFVAAIDAIGLVTEAIMATRQAALAGFSAEQVDLARIAGAEFFTVDDSTPLQFRQASLLGRLESGEFGPPPGGATLGGARATAFGRSLQLGDPVPCSADDPRGRCLTPGARALQLQRVRETARGR